MAQRSLEIVDDHLLAHALEHAFDELNVERMNLIIVLGFLVRKHEVERNLI